MYNYRDFISSATDDYNYYNLHNDKISIMTRYFLCLLFSVLIISPLTTIAAAPPAPVGLCVQAQEGVTQCAVDDPVPVATPIPEPVPASTSNAAAPKGVNPKNFNPGHYLSAGAGNGSPAVVFSDIAGRPNFIGGKRIYTWRSLEPTRGNYDFSRIEADLKYLQSINKRLWIQIGYTQFNGAGLPNTPEYMWRNSSFGCGPENYGTYKRQAQNGGWIPCYWNTNFKSRFEALVNALGARFNGEPFFEGISVGETAIDTAAARLQPGYSISAAENAFKQRSRAVQNAFPDKVTMQMINFAAFDLVSFSSWLANNNIAIGSPDIILHNTLLTDITYPQYLKHHNTVPTGPDVQWDNYTRPKPGAGRSYTAEELLLGAIKGTNPWYMFWQKREPYFSNELLPAISKHGQLPAAKRFYDSIK